VLGKNNWNQRYIKNEIGWDVGRASTPIITYINQVDNKNLKILIPGAGNGYEAEYIYKQGFNDVYVVDWAERALENLSNRCPEFPKQNLFCTDFFEHQGQYDLIIEQTFFCAIKPILRTNYVQKIYELLLDGGKLVGLLFNRDFDKEGPPFGGSEKEYIQLFQGDFSLNEIENCYNSIASRAGTELFIQFVKKQTIK